MTVETARGFEALDAQAKKLMAVFVAAGYEAVSPAIIQPAGVFLDTTGERLRARTYVFADPDGDELCLRPDLTVPTCRLHLARHPDGRAPARYCYNGLAFRFQPAGADAAHPREFHQAGIESFGAADRERADALTVSTVLDGLVAAGLTGARLRIGDLGLFRALIDGVEAPERWRDRLKRYFWRPKAFRAELARLASPDGASRDARAAALLGGVALTEAETAERAVAARLDADGVDLIGVRSLAEISRQLHAAALDAKAGPIDKDIMDLIGRYLAIECRAKDAVGRLGEAAVARVPGIVAAIDAFERRLTLLNDLGVETDDAVFSAEFGRGLEYYTGFVFEVVAPALGPDSPVAGGGRYDALLKTVGAPNDAPAVGAAIHTERLLAATRLDNAP